MREKPPSSIRTKPGASSSDSAASSSVFVFPPFRLDTINEELWYEQRPVVLRRKPMSILRYLLERPRQLITKEELLRELWPDEYVGEGVLTTYLSEIRRALGDSAQSPRFIETAHGRGYRFIGALQGAERRSGPATTAPAAPGAGVSLPLERAAPELLPFVGRGSELRQLEAAFARALAGQRQVVFVTGEAGIGKTRLVKAFLERAAERADTLIAWGQCVDQYGSGEPYLPVLEALGRCCRGPDAPRVLELLLEHAPSWLTLMPSVAHAAGATSAGLLVPERLLREMAELLEALTRDRLLLLWLEDLHWADPSTLDLLSYLAQRSDPARLLLLCSYRSREALGAARLVSIERHLQVRELSLELSLPYLDERAIRTYLDERFEPHVLPTGLAALLHRLTSGNPLFMVKLIGSWLEQGALVRGAQRWELTRELQVLAQDIPESVSRLIERDLERLDDFERGVLEAASVAGPEFSTAALAAGLDENIVRIEAHCTRWGRRGLFLRLLGNAEWPDGTRALRCGFLHALYRHVIYEQLGVAQKAQLHQRIGERLETAHAAAPLDVASELAIHFERSRDVPRAIRYLRLAGDHALQRSAYREATEHLQRALALVAKLPPGPGALELELELCLALGSPLTVIRGYANPEVERVYVRAREICRSLGETAQLATVLSGVAGFFIISGAYAEGVRICEQILELAERYGDSEATASGLLGLGMLQLFRGETVAARDTLEAIIARYEPGRHRVHILQFKQDPSIIALCFGAHAHALLGNTDRALEMAQRCQAHAERMRDPLALTYGLIALQFTHHFRGEYEAAGNRARQLLELCREHGFKLHETIAALGYADASLGAGRVEEAIQLLRAGWEGYRLTGAELGATHWQAQLIEAYTVTGDAQAAWAMIELALHGVQRFDEHHWEAELYRLRGELLLTAPAPGEAFDASTAAEAAERSFLRAIDIARRHDQTSFVLRATNSLARLWISRGREALARERLTEVYRELTEGFDTLDARRTRALLARAQG